MNVSTLPSRAGQLKARLQVTFLGIKVTVIWPTLRSHCEAIAVAVISAVGEDPSLTLEALESTQPYSSKSLCSDGNRAGMEVLVPLRHASVVGATGQFIA